MKIEEVAKAAHEVNRAFCGGLGEPQPSWELAPDWQRESAMDGVLAIIEERVVQPEDSHRSWLAHKKADGWVYGDVKDPDKKTHPCMVPFEDLSVAQQAKDHLFFTVVTALWGM